MICLTKVNSFSVNCDAVSENFISFPVKVTTVKHFKGRPTQENETLISKSNMLIFIKRGRFSFVIDGNSVNLSANNIIILSEGTEYLFEVKSSDCEAVIFYFTQTNEYLFFKSYAALKPGPKNDILSLINKILREHDLKEQFSGVLAGFYITELFILVERFMRHNSLTENCIKNETDSMQRAKKFLDENYDKDINISDLAEYVYLSGSYISHSFKKEFGTSPKRYITEKRLSAAKELLEKTDMSSAEIAAKVGFLSPQRFNSIFKQFEKITPLEYRQKNFE